MKYSFGQKAQDKTNHSTIDVGKLPASRSQRERMAIAILVLCGIRFTPNSPHPLAPNSRRRGVSGLKSLSSAWAAVYTDLWMILQIAGFRPPPPQVWGKLNLQSPPGLRDLGG